jgi:hypothetical protein
MAGVRQRGDRVSAGQGNLEDLDITLKGLIQPADDMAILSYEASHPQQRRDYAALVAPACPARRRLEDGVHQQTRAQPKGAAK